MGRRDTVGAYDGASDRVDVKWHGAVVSVVVVEIKRSTKFFDDCLALFRHFQHFHEAHSAAIASLGSSGNNGIAMHDLGLDIAIDGSPVGSQEKAGEEEYLSW